MAKCCASEAHPIYSVSLSVKQYYQQTNEYKMTLQYTNAAFTALFTLECMLKITAFGCRVRANHKKQSDRKLSTPNEREKRGDKSRWKALTIIICCMCSLILVLSPFICKLSHSSLSIHLFIDPFNENNIQIHMNGHKFTICLSISTFDVIPEKMCYKSHRNYWIFGIFGDIFNS